jgi:ribonuclease HI
MQAIFKGEIDKAPGEVAGAEEHCEVILYTDDEHTLEAIDKWFQDKDGQDDEREAENVSSLCAQCVLNVP